MTSQINEQERTKAKFIFKGIQMHWKKIVLPKLVNLLESDKIKITRLNCHWTNEPLFKVRLMNYGDFMPSKICLLGRFSFNAMQIVYLRILNEVQLVHSNFTRFAI